MEIKHDIKCQECGNPAVYNIQSWYHKYQIDNCGDFKEIDDWEGNDSDFYCVDCLDD